MDTPLIADALDFVAHHLANIQDVGKVRLRMNPLRTALAIGAIKDGLMWTGLALGRPLAEVEADIVVAASCLVEVTG